MCVRFWKIPLHAANPLWSNLHGHGDRCDDTFVRTPSSTMRSRDGLHRKGLADCLSNARSIFFSSFVCLCWLYLLGESRLNWDTFAGMLIGSYIWGCLADTKGRKIVLIATLLMDGIVGIVSSFVQYFWVFLIFRFFNGFAWVW